MPPVDPAPGRHSAGEIYSGRLNRFNEQEILPHFLNDFFVGTFASPLCAPLIVA